MSLVLLAGAVMVQPAAAAGTQAEGNERYSGVESASGDNESADFYKSLWEQVLENGEDVVTFPSRITDELSPSEAAYYGFYLEKPTDLNILLTSDYPCYLMLCQKEQPVNVQTLPFASQKIEERNIPAGYYQIYVIPQEEYEKETVSFTLLLGSFDGESAEPDYSEVDVAGKLYNIISPFRYQSGSDYPRYDKDGYIINTKNHTADAYAVASYFLGWMGPVEEDSSMYSDDAGTLATPSNYMQYRTEVPSLHVQEMILLPGAKNTAEIGSGSYIDHWKNALMTHGAIEAAMSWQNPFFCLDEEGNKTDRYFYSPVSFVEKYGKTFNLKCNHNITVIGWDDSVPKEKFRVKFTYTIDGKVYSGDYMPPGDGAWIIRNSYGEEEHDGGDFYISYYDAFISTDPDRVVFGSIERSRNYNHLYANDLGNTKANGGPLSEEYFRGKTKGMASEAFLNSTDKDELLRAVSFGTPYSGYRYKIYTQVGDEKPQLQKEGYRNYAGIHTVRLDRGVVIPAGAEYRVYVAMELPSPAKDGVGMFYATCFSGTGFRKKLGEIALYHLKGDESFAYKDAKCPVEDGEFPLIHALCYVDLGDLEDDPVNEVTIPDLWFDYDENNLTVFFFKGAKYIYEKGVKPGEGGALLFDEKGSGETKTAALSDVPEDTELKPSSAAETENTKEPVRIKNNDLSVATAGNYRNEKGAVKSSEKGTDDFGDASEGGGLSHEMTAGKVDYRDYNGGAIRVELPESYNLADLDQVTKPRDQGKTQLCWAYAGVKAVESAVMKNYQRLVSYPRGITVEAAGDEKIVSGTVDLTYKKGETKTLSLLPKLISDEISRLDNDTVLWSYEGDADCISNTVYRSRAGEAVNVLSTKSGSGIVRITAQSSSDPSLEVTITVRITEEIPTTVTLSDKEITLKKGESLELKAEVTGSGDVKAVWSSDNPNVATVDQNGKVFAISEGKAVITVKAGTASAECIVYVESVLGQSSKGTSSGGSGGSGGTGKAAYGSGKTTAITEGTWHLEADGSWTFTEKESGQKAVGWKYIRTSDNLLHWFKFGEDCKMLTGWIRDPDGRWYYLATPGDGTALSNAGMTGAMVTGWLTDPSDGYRYFLDLTSGAMVTGERNMNGEKYYFNELPTGATGWHYDENRKKWLFEGGAAIPMGAMLKKEKL